jgi:hypothetical protein
MSNQGHRGQVIVGSVQLLRSASTTSWERNVRRWMTHRLPHDGTERSSCSTGARGAARGGPSGLALGVLTDDLSPSHARSGKLIRAGLPSRIAGA